MAFDFNDSPIRVYGIWPQTPFPVEVSIYGMCRMSCSFCNEASQPVTLYNLRTVPGRDVRVGDRLLGWVKRPVAHRSTRSWAPAVVEEVFRRVAPAVEVELESGERVVCTPDHPWFNAREGDIEYAPVVDRMGRVRKGRGLHRVNLPLLPHQQPCPSYMLGYVRGLADAEGSDTPYQACRISMKDLGPLSRAASYLVLLGLGHFDVRPTPYLGPGMQTLYLPVGSPALPLIRGPHRRDDEYWRGWLAGIYDGDGAATKRYPGRAATGFVRICQSPEANPETYATIDQALRGAGFDTVCEPESVRVSGGLVEAARFAQYVQPASGARQNPFDGFSIKRSQDRVRVAGVRPVGEVEVVSFRTSTHNYVSGGFMSRNCFANLNRTAANHELNPANSLPKLLRKLDRALADDLDPVGFFLRQRYPVCFSNTTDPFQRDESNYRATEAFLGWCKANRVPVYLQTRGNVLFEDFDRYLPLLEPGRVVVYVSICQLDDKLRKRHEPGALRIPERLELMRRLSDHNVPVVAACNPWVRDWVPEPGPYVEAVRDAGARGVWWECLHFTPAQSDVLHLTYRDELLFQANTLPMYLIGVLKGWRAACAAAGLDFFPTPKWDAYFGSDARHPECADPAWLGGNTLDFNFAIVKSLAALSAQSPGKLVLFGWDEIRSALELLGVPNPTLRTSDFWYPYNASVKADRRAWNARLGKQAPLYEVIRYFWNHPWENQHLLWYHPLVQAVCHLKKPVEELYATTDEGDLVGAFNPKIRHHGSFELDYDGIDLANGVVWPRFTAAATEEEPTQEG